MLISAKIPLPLECAFSHDCLPEKSIPRFFSLHFIKENRGWRTTVGFSVHYTSTNQYGGTNFIFYFFLLSIWLMVYVDKLERSLQCPNKYLLCSKTGILSEGCRHYKSNDPHPYEVGILQRT